jgi:hypothetical protein
MAGCSGGDAGPLDTGEPTDASGTPGSTEGGGEEPEPKDPTEATGCSSDDPKFHTHDGWGIRDSFVLYDGQIALAQQPQNELQIDPSGQVVIGYREFDPETDGDDDGSSDKSDIVHQGTKEILVRFSWEDTTIPGLQFWFKHAGSPEFIPLGPVASGQDYVIRLQPRWADMAHQESVSRWAFAIAAYDPAQSSSPAPAHAARGTVNVFMEIHKGDASMIDPPHPAFFCKTSVRYAGDINRSISAAVVAKVEENEVHQGGQLDAFQPEAPHIVPMETTTLRVWLYYNYTGPAAADLHALGLKFHGVDSPFYQSPEPTDVGAGYAYYEIPVDGTMTDSPYAFQTDWEYGVYPIVNGEEQTGDFQGDVHIFLQAVKG